LNKRTRGIALKIKTEKKEGKCFVPQVLPFEKRSEYNGQTEE
jgi:hypothetical protein